MPQNEYYSPYDADKLPENGRMSPRFVHHFTPAGVPTTTTTTTAATTTATAPASGDNTELQFLKVLNKVHQTIEKNEARQADQDRRDTIRKEWQQLALIMDRLLLVCFVILTTSISLALILPGYASQFEYKSRL